VKYKILRYESTRELESAVNVFIRDGFQLAGAPFATPDGYV